MAPPRKKISSQSRKPTFKVDQMVFAKLKGHPAWPAKIMDVMNSGTSKMKYHVYFFATNETAMCKQEELYDYALNKDRLGRTKRKMFPEAMEQIELEIMGGVAGANMRARSEYESKSTESAEVECATKEDKIAECSIERVNSQNLEDVPSVDPTRGAECEGSEKQDVEIGGVENAEKSEETRGVVANDIEGQEATADGSKEDEATAVESEAKVAESTKCGDDTSKTRDGPGIVKGKERTKHGGGGRNVGAVATSTPIQAPLSTSRSGRVIKKKKFLYEGEEDYEVEGSPIKVRGSPNAAPVGAAAAVKAGALAPAGVGEQSGSADMNGGLEGRNRKRKADGERRKANVKETVAKVKKRRTYRRKLFATQDPEERLDLLRIEVLMLDIDSRIKRNVTLGKADLKECIKALDELYELEANALLLKKHPEVLDTVMKLRAYVGNFDDWNQTPEQREMDERNLPVIHARARKIFHKFKASFVVPRGVDFYNFYKREVDKFQERIAKANLTEREIISLTIEPSSLEDGEDEEKHDDGEEGEGENDEDGDEEDGEDEEDFENYDDADQG